MAQEFINKFNLQYEEKHKAYEENFWTTKMNLKGCSTEKLTQTKAALDDFLGSKENLLLVREMLASKEVTPEQSKVLKIFEKTFSCYIIENEERDKFNQLEADLAQSRNKMELGYVSEDGKFVSGSSVSLRNIMRTSDSEKLRKSCYEGMRKIGPHVAGTFSEIIKLRNQFAKSLGFEDYYDMKVNQAEGMSKATLFKILDDLEVKTRNIMINARKTLEKEKGKEALEPYNISYYLSGEISKLKDPYFPFENAVDVWARSFASLGISYKGATMNLDLCDRKGKYSNGFCHWPIPAWMKPNGEWVPSLTNFTSLASPSQIGSGNTALVTLMHEGGHAAHFANVVQNSPLFSQERAPTSVAYAENQSMFLDSLVGDAEWMAKYAKSKDGKSIPFEIIEKEIDSTHAYKVFGLRAMLAVSFYEKALYELDEKDVTAEKIISLADEVEVFIQGGLSPRPLLSVPHILSDESSAYYHGYTLAEMSVHQTRAHFLRKYGFIVDNENVGADLRKEYWQSGNSEPFLKLVENLTGKPLSADDWVDSLSEPVEKVKKDEKLAYEKAIKEGPKIKVGGNADLDMRVILVHGDEVISDSQVDKSLKNACEKYKVWLNANKTNWA